MPKKSACRACIETLPGCHGVAWYWRDVVFPLHPQPDGRYLLRFWMVSFLADMVWGQLTFTWDRTKAARRRSRSAVAEAAEQALWIIAVRVLSPRTGPSTASASATPRNARPWSPRAGRQRVPIRRPSRFRRPGDRPAVRVENLFVRPDCASGNPPFGDIRNASEGSPHRNCGSASRPAARAKHWRRLPWTVHSDRRYGGNETKVDRPHLWNLDDPYLYRVTIRVTVSRSNTCDRFSTRCGFRDFRFVDGAFRLNGRRVFLKCSLRATCFPADASCRWMRSCSTRDLLNSKATGFSMILLLRELRTVASLTTATRSVCWFTKERRRAGNGTIRRKWPNGSTRRSVA